VDVFFDTGVLLAASERSHPHYGEARPALLRVIGGQDKGFISAHSIAELYAALTRLPVHPRIQPVEALQIVNENVLPNFESVSIKRRDYVEALQMAANAGLCGARIHHALMLGCAAKCEPDRIYTFNLADFRLLAPEQLRDKICMP
jgi:predicted nucleic acid-binding protein